MVGVTDPRPTDRPTTRPTTPDQPVEHPDPQWLAVALPVAIWTLTVVVTFLALSGQVEFAEWAGITDGRKYLVPAGLELAAVGFLLVGYRRARRGYSPLGMWALAGLVGSFAVWTNVVHAGDRAGPVFGAFTVVALLLWFVKFRDDYAEHQRRTGQATPRRPKFGWRMWASAPRLTWRARLVAIRLQLSEVRLATVYAELWLTVYDDAAGQPGKLRRRTAWRTVMVAACHPVADLPTTVEVATVAVVDRPPPPGAEPEPTAVADRATPAGPTKPSRPHRSRKATKGRPLRMVWSPTVVANARALRDTFGDRLPTDRQVRDQMGWSYDRARPAIEAHRAGADREPTDRGTPDRSDGDDMESEAAA
jgi:hypothetical protein